MGYDANKDGYLDSHEIYQEIKRQNQASSSSNSTRLAEEQGASTTSEATSGTTQEAQPQGSETSGDNATQTNGSSGESQPTEGQSSSTPLVIGLSVAGVAAALGLGWYFYGRNSDKEGGEHEKELLEDTYERA